MSIRRPFRANWLPLLAVLLFLPSNARAEDEALAPYRERFRLGMDRYREGAVAEAIALWAPIYGEIGGTKGYRLAYNLGVAYDQFGDATRAAEHYQVFLTECANRAARGETEEPLVMKEQTEAKEHLETLVAAKGRVHVLPSSPPVAVQIDQTEPRVAGFVAFVAPGSHVVRTSPGTDAETTRNVAVQRGQVVEIVPDVPHPREIAPEASPEPKTARPKASPPQGPTRPFAAAVLYGFAGAAVATTALPIALYLRAYQLRTDYGTPKGAVTAAEADTANQFSVVRPLAYASCAVPASLAVATIALSALYFSSAGESVSLVVVPDGRGVSGAFGMRF